MKLIFSLLLLLCSTLSRSQGYTLEGNEIKFSQAVRFKTGSAELSPEDINTLVLLKEFLNEKTYITLLRIEAHVSGNANDQQLSEKRALAASRWLVREGIDCKRIIAVGFGNTKPAVQNTRMDFFMASLHNRLIGNMPADGGGRVAGDPCTLRKTSK